MFLTGEIEAVAAAAAEKDWMWVGFLDDQFTQLQQLQDVSKPDIVFEVVSHFFEDSEKLLNELATTQSQQCAYFKKIGAHVHQLKGSSSR
ncbi:hypothetical protein C5167_024751 [Papaver somniferum]|uniref:Histidine-containing phosphotransfer protein n=1 Tax=Papaver somniferum TaxID=3469 RepID=A0A4Y7JSJ0_PAPSO|nr:hypothetical protein C5167_024751 [Papaver somniferum]